MTRSEPQPQPLLTIARAYVQAGRPVFPVCTPLAEGRCVQHGACLNAGKHPMVSWDAYQTRLPTEAEITRWWSRWPEANIGMATGALSGVIVLDADSNEARQEVLRRGIERTPAVWTGRPGGVHFWLQHPGRPLKNFTRGLPGLDFRGDGGYVLLPPSRHWTGSTYRWVDGTTELPPAPVPGWLHELLHPSTPVMTEEAEAGYAATPQSPVDGRDYLDLIRLLNGLPEGERDTTLYRAACKLRADNLPQVYAELLIRQAARLCRPPFEDQAAVEKVARAYRTFAPDPELEIEDDADVFGVATAGAARYPLQTIAELVAQSPDTGGQLVAGIIWAARVNWMFSDPNTGKTLFLFAALMHMAAGRPFAGRAVTQGPVLIIEEDSPLSVAAEYIEDLADIYEFDLAALPIWINRVQGLRVTSSEGLALARAAIVQCPQKPAVVLFDACERLVPSDKFNTKELDPFTRLLQGLTTDLVTPVVIDHTNRNRPEKGETVKPLERLFGARAKSAISDVMWYFDGLLRDGAVRVELAKFRGEAPPGFAMQFNGEVGFTITDRPSTAPTGKSVTIMRFFRRRPDAWWPTSAVVEATGLPDHTVRRRLKQLVQQRWLLHTGDLKTSRYQLNPNLPGPFE